jgi:hypothetical protein
MGLFQSTTPISAGAAQVFDTGGIVSLVEQQKQFEAEQEKYRYQQRQKNEDRLLKAKQQFDPNGLHVRDIPVFQEKIKEYEDFLSANHTALAGGSQNVEVWHKKRALENGIREYMAGSMDFNKKYNARLNVVLTNPRYNTDENKQRLVDAANQPDMKAYEDYSAFQVPEMDAQYFLEPEKYVKAVEKIRTTDSEARNAEGVLSGDYYTIEGEYVYEKGAAKQALAPYWGMTYDDSGQMIEDPNPTSQQQEVRDKYKTIDNFAEKTILSAEKAPADKQLRVPTKASAKSMTTMEKNRPTRVSPFEAQGKTSLTVQTKAPTRWGKPGKYTEKSGENIDLHYDVPTAWSTKGVKGVPLVSDMGGFDISNGVAGARMAQHMTKFDVSHMGYADYAIQPMYVVIEAPDAEGNVQRTVKKLERGALIPKEAIEKYRYDKDLSLDKIINKTAGSHNLATGDYAESDYVGNDLFAFAQATEDPEALSIARPTTGEGMTQFGSSKSQWALKYTDIQHLLDPYLKKLYPDEMQEMLNQKPQLSPEDRAAQAARRNQIQ